MGQVLVMADYGHLKRLRFPDPVAFSLDMARQWYLLGLASMALIAEIVDDQQRR